MASEDVDSGVKSLGQISKDVIEGVKEKAAAIRETDQALRAVVEHGTEDLKKLNEVSHNLYRTLITGVKDYESEEVLEDAEVLKILVNYVRVGVESNQAYMDSPFIDPVDKEPYKLQLERFTGYQDAGDKGLGMLCQDEIEVVNKVYINSGGSLSDRGREIRGRWEHYLEVVNTIK